jgi:arylsulfatase A-like enzyme
LLKPEKSINVFNKVAHRGRRRRRGDAADIVETMRTLFRLVLLLALAVIISCGRNDRRVNVVIIGIDTLRRDHLGCYGYDRNTTPNIDKLAATGVLFENAVSQSPWTLPSFATVFTSLYPTQHGAVSRGDRMRTGFPTLAAILRANDYATGALVNAPVMSPAYKLDRGFDYYSYKGGIRDRVADATTVSALEWIDDNSGKPFFIFVHYFDPHVPYSPPPPYDTLFAPDSSAQSRRFFFPDKSHIDELTASDWDEIRALYDGEIAFTDEAVRRLLEGLEERGLRENTLIILLSDHGEEFYDHGGFEHGHTLYDELIKVPLVFALPGVVPDEVRIPRQVRLLDVCPTILDLVGIDSGTHFEGVSLKHLIMGDNGQRETAEGRILPAHVAYSEALLYPRPGERKCVTAYNWKLIYDVKTAEELFFNLAEDPGEHLNLAGDGGEPLTLLEENLSKILLAISDTWFVEIAGSKSGSLIDIEVRCVTPEGATYFGLVRLLDGDHKILRTADVPEARVSANIAAISDLEVTDPITLCFTLERQETPVGFDIRIDGTPAVDNTYVGRSLSKPATMPFIRALAGKDESTKGEPDSRPDPPYVLIWRSGSAYEGETSIVLDAKTKRDLRAVGYIQ